MMADDTSIPYREESDPVWNEEAVRTSAVEVLPDEKRPVRIVITGPCPRCHHDSRHVEPVIIVRGVDDALPDDASREIQAALDRAGVSVRDCDVEVLCACGVAHPGTPEGESGCGGSWSLTVSWGSEP
jgi:hypothetical protein